MTDRARSSIQIGWRCRRCGLGLLSDTEPGHCGCWTSGDDWDYERLELIDATTLFAAIQEQERLRAALGSAANDMFNAHNLLSPGMKAGVGQAKAILQAGANDARKNASGDA
jgi:hypothetical protein